MQVGNVGLRSGSHAPVSQALLDHDAFRSGAQRGVGHAMPPEGVAAVKVIGEGFESEAAVAPDRMGPGIGERLVDAEGQRDVLTDIVTVYAEHLFRVELLTREVPHELV